MNQKREKVSKVRGFSGTLEVLDLFEVVQIVCIAELSTCLVVDMGIEMGELYFLNGNIVHAAVHGTYEIIGENAFKAIMRWHSGKFSTIHGKIPKVKSIDKNWKQLFLDIFTVEERPVEESGLDDVDVRNNEISNLIDRGFSLVVQRNYEGAIEVWSRAQTLDPENKMVEYNLNKLRDRIATKEKDYEGLIRDLKTIFLTTFDGKWGKVIERLDSAERSAEGIKKVCHEIEKITLLFIDKKKANEIREGFLEVLRRFSD